MKSLLQVPTFFIENWTTTEYRILILAGVALFYFIILIKFIKDFKTK